MEFADVVRRRRMVRRYRSDSVDAAALRRVLDAARRGPSAGWTQGVSFVVVSDPERRASLARLCDEEDYVARGLDAWLSGAPVHVVLCVRPDDYRARYALPDKAASTPPDAWDVPFWWVDAGAALQLLLLAAVDEGLAAGFLAVDDPDGVRALLAIPPDVAIVGLVTVGSPAMGERRSRSLRRGRRALAQVVHFETW